MAQRLKPALILSFAAASLGCHSEPKPRAQSEGGAAEVTPKVEHRSEKANAMLDRRERIAKATELMLGFAERTGLSSKRAERRYLWTDAFAVMNFLGLSETGGDARNAELALSLIDHVHHTLGRHRSDDPRRGWLSGLSDRDAEAHPTRGGLRIGKDLPERKPGEAFDSELEWERDGQYFHYLTKWMQALDRASRSTHRPGFNLWARELARAAEQAFVHGGTGQRRMYWKMSIDLSRPLVGSMGQHDALDGYVTCAMLRATASGLPGSSPEPSLAQEQTDFFGMIDRHALETADPLGLGGLLSDAWHLEQLVELRALKDDGLVNALLEAALRGLAEYARQGELKAPASRRLAFRELGLAIGLHAVEAMRKPVAGSDAQAGYAERRSLLEALARFLALGAEIEAFWLDAEHQRAESFGEHRDINEVMLATALVPEGFLTLRPL